MTGAPDAADTRRKLLESAFEEFFRRGFQGGSIETIVARAGVTKGALYHHFPDKAALGHAVLDEVVREPLLSAYLEPLEDIDGDPLTALQDVLRRRADDFVAGGVELGCPLNNLGQEMSQLDEGFRTRVAATLAEWTAAFARVIDDAKAWGSVRADVDAHRLAALIVAAVEGSFGMAKAERQLESLRSNLGMLADLLDSVRPRRP